jgi:predicted DCC family thiol-disulfide oxidoreductase YuxK
MDKPQTLSNEPIVVHYDGPCLLCDGFVRFAARHDRADRLRFVPLGSPRSNALLSGKAVEPESVIVTEGPQRFVRSEAVLHALGVLSWPWRLLTLLRIVPLGIRDSAYDAVAARRTRLFGRAESCPVPTAELLRKRLD